MSLSVQEAFLIAAVIQASLWGIYTAIFFSFLWVVFVKQRQARNVRSVVYALAIPLYLVATAHFALVFRRLHEAFILYVETIPPGTYYNQFSHVRPGVIVAKQILYGSASVIGDSILVWRCHILWGRKYFYITAIPATLILLQVVGDIVCTYEQVFKTPSDLVLSWRFALTYLTCVLLTNMIATILLAARIWWLARRTSLLFPSAINRRYHSALLLTIESGAILSAAKAIEFVLFMRTMTFSDGPNLVYIVFDAMPQIVGMVPTAILILISLGIAPSNAGCNSSAIRTPIVFRTRAELLIDSDSGRSQGVSISLEDFERDEGRSDLETGKERSFVSEPFPSHEEHVLGRISGSGYRDTLKEAM